MSAFLPAVLALALAFPRPWGSAESPADYDARVAVMVEAASLETSTPAELVAVLVLWHAESGFALKVHSGERLGDGGRAACLGQLHKGAMVPPAEWATLGGVGLESTRRCARATIRVLRWAAARCNSWAGAFTLYGTGKQCRALPFGLERSRRLSRALNTLARATSDTL